MLRDKQLRKKFKQTALKMELHCCIQQLPKSDLPLIEKSTSIQKLVDTNVHLVQRIGCSQADENRATG